MARVRWPAGLPAGVSRGGSTAGDLVRDDLVGDDLVGDDLVESLASDTLQLIDVRSTRPARRGAAPARVDVSVEGAGGDAFVIVTRQPSGALTFHVPNVEERSAARRGARLVRFSIPVASSATPARRGLAGKAARLFVFKVVRSALDALANRALPEVAGAWEASRITEGLKRITPGTFPEGLVPASGPIGGRSLLLIHGTFSSTAGAFADLAGTLGSDGRDLFTALSAVYGDRIYAFDHFTVSKSPEENAEKLLHALPKQPTTFDVITHSRGGLVLRNLMERRAFFGAVSSRFQLGHAVLVASPNEGTPLAGAARWDTLLGWVANILDVVPGNPWTDGLAFVSEALVWLAARVEDSLPGLASMAPGGLSIRTLQAPPPPPADAYSALVANYEADAGLLARALDAGVDGFFEVPNDLVVPTEGGFRVDGAAQAIPGARIGAFGPGGNLVGDGRVHHVSFFRQTETVDFLVRSLTGQSHALAPIDAALSLGVAAARRGEQLRAARPPRRIGGEETGGAWEREPGSGAGAGAGAEIARSAASGDAFHLFLLLPDRRLGDSANQALLLATYRNARVAEPFRTRGDEAGKRWYRIIRLQERLKGYVDGNPKMPALPTDGELVAFGKDLFEAMFPGRIRRLYDAVRNEKRGRRLDVVFTSMIDWVADKPWELAFDPDRKTFLATEEVNFHRDVLTAIPADPAPAERRALRILVAAAQPLGEAPLSAEEEIALVRRGFTRLVDEGLASVDVLPSATPQALQEALQLAELRGAPYDVLHFIGHGEYRRDEGRGYLLFETAQGGALAVSADALRPLLCRRGLRLVFLNACETGNGRGDADFNRGVAQALVAGGLPAVAANQYKVLDVSATAFARHFYWSLANGARLGDAAREARIAVRASLEGESIDWAVPVLFAQNPGETLVSPTTVNAALSGAAGVATPAAGTPRRRVARPGAAERVGLWDVNDALPMLPDVVARMNAVQSAYVFDTVRDASAPFGTWRLERGADDGGEGFLFAARVARRLRPLPVRLGLARLICVTSFRLGDDEFRDLYAWDEDPESRLSILSLAILRPKIDAAGLPLARAVVNLVVGSLSGLPSHRAAPRSCPQYFNDAVDARWVAGPLAFDAACRRKARKALGAARASALDSLLLAYGSA